MADLAPITIARFWSKVDVQDFQDCWNWTASKTDFGYGKFQNLKSHRVAFEILNSEIPQGMSVCHKCDNPSCCNPHHMFLGTKADNNRDAMQKGRSAFKKGENHPMSKLTDQQVEYIRSSSMTGVALAAQLGVSKSTISGIRTFTHRT